MTLAARPAGPIARLGAETSCGYCAAPVRYRHGVPFEGAEGGAWRLEDDGHFWRPGQGAGTHQLHRCGRPAPPPVTESQLTLEVES